MREILFKGFHECENGSTVITVNGEEKRGKWVEGSYVYYEHCPQHQIFQNVDIGGNGYYEPKYALIDFEVVPETVCQYTGLTDKNGKKIFENDVVKAICRFDEANMYVEYDSSIATFCLFDKDRIGFKHLCDIHNREIIGNIFDNPELLKSEE